MTKKDFLQYVNHFAARGVDLTWNAFKANEIEELKSFDSEFGRLYEKLVNDEFDLIRLAKSRLEK